MQLRFLSCCSRKREATFFTPLVGPRSDAHTTDNPDTNRGSTYRPLWFALRKIASPGSAITTDIRRHMPKRSDCRRDMQVLFNCPTLNSKPAQLLSISLPGRKELNKSAPHVRPTLNQDSGEPECHPGDRKARQHPLQNALYKTACTELPVQNTVRKRKSKAKQNRRTDRHYGHESNSPVGTVKFLPTGQQYVDVDLADGHITGTGSRQTVKPEQ